MTKREERRKYRALRDQTDPEKRIVFSRQIFDRLESLPAFRQAETVFCYVSAGSEAGTHELIFAMLKEGKTVCVPKVSHGGMSAVAISEDTAYAAGELGIAEPVGGCEIEPGRVDLVLVPALAFDRNCNRLGQGGGYYDRYLEGLPAFKIGLAFECQIADQIETQDHDVPMDLVVTERETYPRK